MPKFTKAHLQYIYAWKNNATPITTQSENNVTVLDSTKGAEVLDFCNNFLRETEKLPLLSNFHHVEKCLHHPDLKNVHSKLLLTRRIRENWFAYMSATYSLSF